jgi:hypothetical protein
VGRVAFFVKATVGEKCMDAVQALGLPTQPQRFAIVQAYSAEDVQGGLAAATAQKPWVKAAAQALVDAKLLTTTGAYLRLLAKVRDMATVLAIGEGSRVALKGRTPGGGSLKLLAIPLSSNYEAWYHRTPSANWAVHPVCRIDRRRVKVHMDGGRREVDRAIAAARRTLMYFVHTYSKSNAKLRRV